MTEKETMRHAEVAAALDQIIQRTIEELEAIENKAIAWPPYYPTFKVSPDELLNIIHGAVKALKKLPASEKAA